MTFAILCESGKIPVAKAHLSRSMLAANQSLWHFSASKHISEWWKYIFKSFAKVSNWHLFMFFPLNSVISMHIDIKHLCYHFIMVWVQQIQHWPLIRHFETYVICPLLKFTILKDEYHRVIIIEPSNQVCVTITKRQALSACQSTIILFSATGWFSKWFMIGMTKKQVSLHLVWKIKWAIWWQISRHWLDFTELYKKRQRNMGVIARGPIQ